MDNVLICWDCLNKVHGGVNQTEIISQFWTLEVQGQSSDRILFLKTVGENQFRATYLASSFLLTIFLAFLDFQKYNPGHYLHLLIVFSMCMYMSVSKFSFSIKTPVILD